MDTIQHTHPNHPVTPTSEALGPQAALRGPQRPERAWIWGQEDREAGLEVAFHC